ncbi:unnamed protein product [Penicillium salamii]|uniref:Uncharacterized protein n=1 Tax=Penicillium salamii TaxID=1612424 RepID=A0A9W4JST7_9EURO|nr:unnamed protein product [Penicillium salamii]CAG8061945.1 unnamed protein product [Penicillium salamii]CAG8181888.1 unnamed protein product [Penicillium salamii]CAG8213904.1 unnamed protein product [Penicillium salamii]CAG8248460.1 unnamed protein product [Penicillium salamii]
MKGAGTNIDIVVSVTFKAFASRIYSVCNWVVPLSNSFEANCSADLYLYWDVGYLYLSVTMFESFETGLSSEMSISMFLSMFMGTILGPEDNFESVDNVGLFESEMYISGMHGGHSGSRTSLFK